LIFKLTAIVKSIYKVFKLAIFQELHLNFGQKDLS